jgi:hypothetical protein
VINRVKDILVFVEDTVVDAFAAWALGTPRLGWGIWLMKIGVGLLGARMLVGVGMFPFYIRGVEGRE